MNATKFYLGTHKPRWLWMQSDDRKEYGQADMPLFVSYRQLGQINLDAIRPATVPGWALDSGGFTELQMHGKWTVPAEEYVWAVALYDREIGKLEWAAPQDWMCEPIMRHGGMAANGQQFTGTGLSVREHQERTVASFLELQSLWPQYSEEKCPFMPVLQGWEPGEYLECAAIYEAAGVHLADYEIVGVGSVCRRQSTDEIRAIVDTLKPLGLAHHYFGVKLTGIKLAGLRTHDVYDNRQLVEGGAASLDSSSWSFDARYEQPLPECSHAGGQGKCNNCPKYATKWAQRVLARLEAAAQGEAEPVTLEDHSDLPACTPKQNRSDPAWKDYDGSPGARYDDEVRAIWADIPRELGTQQAWKLAKPGMKAAQQRLDEAMARKPAPARGLAPMAVEPRRAAGIKGIAAMFDVAETTVRKWFERYPGTQPEADTWIDDQRGWTLPDREPEWRAWKASLPGQGAPGHPKPRKAKAA